MFQPQFWFTTFVALSAELKASGSASSNVFPFALSSLQTHTRTFSGDVARGQSTLRIFPSPHWLKPVPMESEAQERHCSGFCAQAQAGQASITRSQTPCPRMRRGYHGQTIRGQGGQLSGGRDVVGTLMQVRFELTRDDYAALTFARAPSSAQMRRRFLVLGVLLTLVVLLLGLLTLLTGDLSFVDRAPLLRPLSYATAATLAAFFLLSLALVGVRRWVRSVPRDDGALLGVHELELSDAGFTVEGRAGRSFVRWSAVVELRETESHVFLFVDRMLAYVVPKRAFSDRDACAHFVTYVRGHTRANPAA